MHLGYCFPLNALEYFYTLPFHHPLIQINSLIEHVTVVCYSSVYKPAKKKKL